MRKLAWTLLIVLITLSVVGLSTVAVLKSTSGSAWVVRQVAARMFPGDLSIESVKGNLFSELTMANIHGTTDTLSLCAKQIKMRSGPMSLLRGEIKDLSIGTVDLVLADSASPGEYPMFKGNVSSLPFSLSADRVAISKMHIEAEGKKIDIQRINMNAKLDRKQLVVEVTGNLFEQVQFGFYSEIQLLSPLLFNGRANWRSPLFDTLSTSGTCRFNGNSKKVKVDICLQNPFVLTASGALWADETELVFSGDQKPKEATAIYSPESNDILNLPITKTLAVRLDKVNAKTLDGMIAVDGRLLLQDEPEWKVALQATQLNPAIRFSDWPGRLDIKADLQGCLVKSELQQEISNLRLHGRLIDQPFDISGNIKTAGAFLSSAALQVASGANTLKINGNGENLLFDFQISDPYPLWPPFRGVFTGNGTVGNLSRNPEIVLQMEGEKIKYRGGSIARLNANAQIDLGAKSVKKVRLELSQLQLMNTMYPSLSVLGTGNTERMDMAGTIKGSNQELAFELLGAGKQDVWEMALKKMSLASKKKGVWRLSQLSMIHWNKDKMEPAKICWSQGNENRCITVNWQFDEGLKINGELEVPPFTFIESFGKGLLDSKNKKDNNPLLSCQ